MSASTSSSNTGKPVAYDRDLIEKEIEHLKKRKGVRNTSDTQRAKWKIFVTLATLALIWLYTMDVFLFSYDRGDAARVYLYLHNYGNNQKAEELQTCGLLTPYEVKQLDRQQGAYQDYFSGTVSAEKKAADLVNYMNQVHALHDGKYDSLSTLSKVRYFLFIRTGLTPPTRWDALNSTIVK